jgi:hypothetical protein
MKTQSVQRLVAAETAADLVDVQQHAHRLPTIPRLGRRRDANASTAAAACLQPPPRAARGWTMPKRAVSISAGMLDVASLPMQGRCRAHAHAGHARL